MFEQRHGIFTIYCDERKCQESEEFDTDNDFRSFIDEAKAAGWRVYKDGSNWAHKCPSCQRAPVQPSATPSRKYVLEKDVKKYDADRA